MVGLAPMTIPASADNSTGIEIIETAINPANNNTYHLLSASSWSDAAEAARGLDGFLVTVNDADEDQWLYETFAAAENATRHIWIGLSDYSTEGDFRWHDGTPFAYRNWGEGQPVQGSDEDYVHITGTNLGAISENSWNDLEDDPQYFPVFGVVEVGPGADFALRFDGEDDHVKIDSNSEINISQGIIIEAMIKPFELDGKQFITMKGDYGWGLYLDDDKLAYASEYSLSKHPKSNLTIPTDSWVEVRVEIDPANGGEFFINNESAGNISAEDAKIPAGDFGSNNCYQNNDSCDELYIGKMGAACDCNYFAGMIDDLYIRTYHNSVQVSNNSSWYDSSNWRFDEGEGSSTFDQNGDEGVIHGAAWVMPDGGIVAQAVKLENNEYIQLQDISANKTLLFYLEIPENTLSMSIDSWAGGWNGNFRSQGAEIYVANGYIPSPWQHDKHIESEWNYLSYEWSRPENGTWWIVVTFESDIPQINIGASWDEAPIPPPLEEMTELNDGVAITGLKSLKNGNNADDLQYFYVDLKENLSELKVKTFGGRGDADLFIEKEFVPITAETWGDFEPENIQVGQQSDEQSNVENKNSDQSTSPGSEETVQIFGAETGIYYIVVKGYGQFNGVSIQADFTYAPQNIAPGDAIELKDDIEHGPLTGYSGLEQHFYIEVDSDVERLEVSLAKGFGEAKIYMRHETSPTQLNFDHISAAPGSNDKIGFNNPSPGRWNIMVTSETVFSGVFITASFEDLYVWTYDGLPIELYSDDEMQGLEAPAGEDLLFYVTLADPGNQLSIKTFGGEGSLTITAEGERMSWGFNQGQTNDRPGRQQQSSEQVKVESDGEGTQQSIEVFLPAPGRFDITVSAINDFSGVSIVASWQEQGGVLDPVIEPDTEPTSILTCQQIAEQAFSVSDKDENGLLDVNEAWQDEADEEIFVRVDIDDDGLISLQELKQEICSCSNEITLVFEQYGADEVGMEAFSSLAWSNDFNLIAIDNDGNSKISDSEVNTESLDCTTTYDAFDRDGDGTPDNEDAFPDDSSEQKDSDGDGVGDNSDVIASVPNDILYAGGGIIGFILIVLFSIMLFSMRSPKNIEEEVWNDPAAFDSMSEMMMGMEDSNPLEITENIENNVGDSSIDLMSIDVGNLNQPNPAVSIDLNINDLFDGDKAGEIPPANLMGMLGNDGKESIEWPSGSGQTWSRSSPDEDWS